MKSDEINNLQCAGAKRLHKEIVVTQAAGTKLLGGKDENWSSETGKSQVLWAKLNSITR